MTENSIFIRLEIENPRANGPTENWIVFGAPQGKNQLLDWRLGNKIYWVQLQIKQLLSIKCFHSIRKYVDKAMLLQLYIKLVWILFSLTQTPILSASGHIALPGEALLMNKTGESARGIHLAVPSLAQPNRKQSTNAWASGVAF